MITALVNHPLDKDHPIPLNKRRIGMGEKGAKLTDVSTQAAEDLQSRLSTLGDVTTKKMFGGHGIFESGKMFALVDSGGTVFFKADETNRERFEKAGSQKHARMPYFKVPDQILSNDTDLLEWAQTSIVVARNAK
jgi:DNA transformation protein